MSAQAPALAVLCRLLEVLVSVLVSVLPVPVLVSVLVSVLPVLVSVLLFAAVAERVLLADPLAYFSRRTGSSRFYL